MVFLYHDIKGYDISADTVIAFFFKLLDVFLCSICCTTYSYQLIMALCLSR